MQKIGMVCFIEKGMKGQLMGFFFSATSDTAKVELRPVLV